VSGILLYDDARARELEPFALTRPMADMTAGTLLQRDRWQAALQMPVAGTISAPHLADFDESNSSPAARGGIPAGSVIANARFVPRLSTFQPPNESGDGAPDLWLSGGRVVAVRASREIPADHFADGRRGIDDLARSGAETAMLDGWWIEQVWDLVRLLQEQLADDLAAFEKPVFGGIIAGSQFGPPPEHCIVLGKHPVLIASDRVVVGEVVMKGATIEPQVVIDASSGPVYVGAGTTVNAFTRLVGPCYVGRNSTVLGDRITGCSIGDHCKVRGEMSTTVMVGHANKGHDGFVGHSYLGRWVNLGAGTITSNLKNTYGPVSLWTRRGMMDTGMQFLGTMFGDHAKTGIGTSLTTGTVLGAGANVYGSQAPPKAVPPFAWGSAPPYEVYRLDKFLEVAERVMSRRHVTLSDRARRQLAASHRARWSVEQSD
jgi:UDP-N-acetylglucosamine diphosphorylase / glucose-1-phosphate thymidylyltransferase / UDP-N-acetylgalactosamine diphosphorylase / glucosamine-1-phosphate N-acetyltransferase / galactosamine-1-phosphate N-acetyltransferase